MFKVSSSVRVVERGSCFFDRCGTVKEIRDGPLPYGVQGVYQSRSDNRDLVWFDEVELELT